MKILLVLLLCPVLFQSAIAEATKDRTKAQNQAEKLATSQYTFSWPFLKRGEMAPRGGMTRGPVVTTTGSPSTEWKELRESKLTKFERDRRAILAMQGEYRVSFDFIETTVFKEPYEAARPYQSWGTELVYVISDTGKFISLQHILVIQTISANGELREPIVMKHWRQDWHHEDLALMIYIGNNSWKQIEIEQEAASGHWSQAVYQVDDSPRYEAIGEWLHTANHSSWLSDETWRPIPRRESSVRDDYDVLVGTNRHTITPKGWTHEENNLKVVLDNAGLVAKQGVIAKEIGFNRYERITGYDFSAGVGYWETTSAFWAEVREAWSEKYRTDSTVTIKPEVEGTTLFGEMFFHAESVLNAKEPFDSTRSRLNIDRTLKKFLHN